MCTLIALRRPGHPWPLLVAANRDEMMGRPWAGPGRHWPDRPEVLAGIDHLAGGSWLGINDTGVVAGVLNRRDSLGPDPALRSRGELVLEALDHADAVDAVAALSHIDARAYRSFNLVIADSRDGWWIRALGPTGSPTVEAFPIPPGLSMFTSLDVNDPASPRVRRYLPQFEAATPPNPDAEDWQAWQRLMASRTFEEGHPDGAMNFSTSRGFGTVSSSLIAIPDPVQGGTLPIWRFAGGPPDDTAFQTVDLA